MAMRVLAEATGLSLYIVSARCVAMLFVRQSMGDHEAFVRSCRNLLSMSSANGYVDELSANRSSKVAPPSPATDGLSILNGDLSKPSLREKLSMLGYPLLVHMNVILLMDNFQEAVVVASKMEKSGTFSLHEKEEAYRIIFDYLLTTDQLFIEAHTPVEKSLLLSFVPHAGLIGMRVFEQSYHLLSQQLPKGSIVTEAERFFVWHASHQTLLKLMISKYTLENAMKRFQAFESLDDLSYEQQVRWATEFLATENAIPSSLVIQDEHGKRANMNELVGRGDQNMYQDAAGSLLQSPAVKESTDLVEIDDSDDGPAQALNEMETEEKAISSNIDNPIELVEESVELVEESVELDEDSVELDDDSEVSDEVLEEGGCEAKGDSPTKPGMRHEYAYDDMVDSTTTSHAQSEDEDQSQSDHQDGNDSENPIDLDDTSESDQQVGDDSDRSIELEDVCDSDQSQDDQDRDSDQDEEVDKPLDDREDAERDETESSQDNSDQEQSVSSSVDRRRLEGGETADETADEDSVAAIKADLDGETRTAVASALSPVAEDAEVLEVQLKDSNVAHESPSSRGEAGYDAEDSQGHTEEEEEVSEEFHTDEEDESRPVEEVRENDRSSRVDINRHPDRIRRSESHNLSDMDFADEMTAEHEDDPGAESSELEESAEAYEHRRYSFNPAATSGQTTVSLHDFALLAQQQDATQRDNFPTMPSPQAMPPRSLTTTDMAMADDNSQNASLESMDEGEMGDNDSTDKDLVDHVPTDFQPEAIPTTTPDHLEYVHPESAGKPPFELSNSTMAIAGYASQHSIETSSGLKGGDKSESDIVDHVPVDLGEQDQPDADATNQVAADTAVAEPTELKAPLRHSDSTMAVAGYTSQNSIESTDELKVAEESVSVLELVDPVPTDPVPPQSRRDADNHATAAVDAEDDMMDEREESMVAGILANLPQKAAEEEESSKQGPETKVVEAVVHSWITPKPRASIDSNATEKTLTGRSIGEYGGSVRSALTSAASSQFSPSPSRRPHPPLGPIQELPSQSPRSSGRKSVDQRITFDDSASEEKIETPTKSEKATDDDVDAVSEHSKTAMLADPPADTGATKEAHIGSAAEEEESDTWSDTIREDDPRRKLPPSRLINRQMTSASKTKQNGSTTSSVYSLRKSRRSTDSVSTKRSRRTLSASHSAKKTKATVTNKEDEEPQEQSDDATEDATGSRTARSARDTRASRLAGKTTTNASEEKDESHDESDENEQDAGSRAMRSRRTPTALRSSGKSKFAAAVAKKKGEPREESDDEETNASRVPRFTRTTRAAGRPRNARATASEKKAEDSAEERDDHKKESARTPRASRSVVESEEGNTDAKDETAISPTRSTRSTRASRSARGTATTASKKKEEESQVESDSDKEEETAISPTRSTRSTRASRSTRGTATTAYKKKEEESQVESDNDKTAISPTRSTRSTRASRSTRGTAITASKKKEEESQVESDNDKEETAISTTRSMRSTRASRSTRGTTASKMKEEESQVESDSDREEEAASQATLSKRPATRRAAAPPKKTRTSASNKKEQENGSDGDQSDSATQVARGKRKAQGAASKNHTGDESEGDKDETESQTTRPNREAKKLRIAAAVATAAPGRPPRNSRPTDTTSASSRGTRRSTRTRTTR